MTTTVKELFIVGLRNAHAMETQAREMLERQSGRLDDYPEVKLKVVSHLEETKQQIMRLDECLKGMGETSSTMKDTVQSFMGNMAAMAHTAAEDEILKNTFANNAFENFEIAAYKSLLAMCDAAGANSCKTPLQNSLREEEQMATWISNNVEKVTKLFIERQLRTAA